MRFVWPIKADYRIVYVSENYEHTIVGREKRDYLWIMARTPQIADADYDTMLAIAKREGYDLSKVDTCRSIGRKARRGRAGSAREDCHRR
jgi:apolipoprotein D and lipocalin family protein